MPRSEIGVTLLLVLLPMAIVYLTCYIVGKYSITFSLEDLTLTITDLEPRDQSVGGKGVK